MPAVALYTPELLQAICDRLASGEPLEAICRSEGMPASRTVRQWALDDAEIAREIAKARDFGADAIADQAFAILDLPPAYKTDAAGNTSIDTGDVANRKLQVEGRLKLLAKWNPKRYGDRMAVEHSGKVGLESLVAGDPPSE